MCIYIYILWVHTYIFIIHVSHMFFWFAHISPCQKSSLSGNKSFCRTRKRRPSARQRSSFCCIHRSKGTSKKRHHLLARFTGSRHALGQRFFWWLVCVNRSAPNFSSWFLIRWFRGLEPWVIFTCVCLWVSPLFGPVKNWADPIDVDHR